MIDMPWLDGKRRGTTRLQNFADTSYTLLVPHFIPHTHTAHTQRTHIAHTYPNANVECQSFLCALSAFDELLKENRAYV